jgi:hypothetical protein
LIDLRISLEFINKFSSENIGMMNKMLVSLVERLIGVVKGEDKSLVFPFLRGV